ncbi:penicillin-binding protein activator [Cognatishimia maritima]|uniref:Amino acid/amide ABC transporter substrate-binding protein, HAAT family n=1 Tax=Cognatishimia maritima TaxID=870908 RepID=A0A1M5RZT1_9RHOB|nr:penicillin-binding protein activator [Cognatishimia maritima]SHH31661.1 amino acid/amide ABC transporter substrate-binding protein, HAAT family [Cognatishimia maritima]
MFAAFKPRRQFLKGLVAVAAAAVVSACEPVGIGGGPSVNTSKPIPVALLVPQSSQASGDSVLSQSLENAARLAMADLGDVQIDLRVYDTAGDDAVAQAAALRAVSEGAKIVLGPVRSGPSNAVGVALRGKNVNVLSFSNNTSIAGGNVFVLGPTFDNTAMRLAQFAARNGKSDVLTVHANNVAGIAGRDAISRALAFTSASNAGAVSYEFSQQGVVASVQDVRSAVRSTGADAIFLTSDTSGALPLFTQLLPESGVNPAEVQYMGLTRWDIPAGTLELPGVQGGWFALPDPALTDQFRARYAAAYGGTPHPIGGLAYDGIAAIGALVSQGKSDALTAAALTQGAGFKGVNGIFRLRADGTNERGLAVATVRDKQVVIIDPAPRSFGGAGF